MGAQVDDSLFISEEFEGRHMWWGVILLYIVGLLTLEEFWILVDYLIPDLFVVICIHIFFHDGKCSRTFIVHCRPNHDTQRLIPLFLSESLLWIHIFGVHIDLVGEQHSYYSISIRAKREGDDWYTIPGLRVWSYLYWKRRGFSLVLPFYSLHFTKYDVSFDGAFTEFVFPWIVW